MNKDTGIEFLLFDLGNVIIDLDLKHTERAILELTGIPYDGYHIRVHDVFVKFEKGEISEEIFINALLKEANDPKVDARAIIDVWNSMLVGIPEERVHLLKELRGKYTLCALSNTNKTHIDWVNEHLKGTHDTPALEDLFDHLFLSFRVNERKPEAGYFRYVLDKLDSDPGKMVFIDDHLNHVHTALRVGIPAVHKPADVPLDRSFLDRSRIE